MSDSNDSLGAFLAGFVIGGMTGAVVALLLAPQSGEDTREMIRERGIELKMKAEQTADEFRVRAGETADELRSRTGEIRSRAERTLAEGRERLEDVAENVRQKLPRKKSDTAEA